MPTEQRHAAVRLAAWVADRELFLIGAVAPFLLFPEFAPVLTVVAALAIPALWACRWVANGHLTKRSPFDWPILALMLMLPISVLVSPFPLLSLPKLTTLLLGIALHYGLVNAAQGKRILILIPAIALAVTLLGLVGTDWFDFKIPLLSPIYPLLPRFIQGVPRTMRGGFHPNEVGATLAMLLPLVWVVYRMSAPRPLSDDGASAMPWWRRLGHWRFSLLPLLFIMLVMLILTQSRTAIAASAISCFFLLPLTNKQRIVIGGALTLFLLVAWLLLGFFGMGPLALILEWLPGTHTWAGRPEIWRNALYTIRDYPLTGIGLNAFAPASRARYAYMIAGPRWDFVHAHNVFLQVGVDFGVIGLLAFVALLAVFYAACLSQRVERGDRRTRLLFSGLLASMTAYIAFGTIDTLALGAKPSILFWLATGLSARFAWEQAPQKSHGYRRYLSWAACVALVGLALLLPVASAPVSSRLLSNWGHVAVNQGLYAPAVAIMERALAADPGNRSAWRGLLDALAKSHQVERALPVAQRMGVSAVDLAQRGESARRIGALSEAEFWQKVALHRDPTLGDAWYYLALIRRDQRQSVAAVEALEKALASDHFSKHVTADHVWQHYRGPQAWLLVDAGNALLADGETGRAIALMERVTGLDPGYGPAWLVLGKAHFQAESLDQAEAALAQALARDPQSYWAHVILADVQEKRGDWQQALALQQAGLQVARHEDHLLFGARAIARLYQRLGREAEACAALRDLWQELESPLAFDAVAKDVGCRD